MEILKTVGKEKYDKSDAVCEYEDCDISKYMTEREGIGIDQSISKIELEEKHARSKMIYDKEDNSLDLGRLKTTSTTSISTYRDLRVLKGNQRMKLDRTKCFQPSIESRLRL